MAEMATGRVNEKIPTCRVSGIFAWNRDSGISVRIVVPSQGGICNRAVLAT